MKPEGYVKIRGALPQANRKQNKAIQGAYSRHFTWHHFNGNAPGPAGPASHPNDQIIELIPSLRAFAKSLVRNPVEADDLLQEALLRALASIDQFRPGSNMKAWLFRIQRNVFYTHYRKRRRESALLSDTEAEIQDAPQQEWSIKMKAMHRALEELPQDQREALMLVSGAGLSYEEAAEVCDCAMGTIKSRVSRARCRLLKLLEVDDREEFLETDRHVL